MDDCAKLHKDPKNINHNNSSCLRQLWTPKAKKYLSYMVDVFFNKLIFMEHKVVSYTKNSYTNIYMKQQMQSDKYIYIGREKQKNKYMNIVMTSDKKSTGFSM